MSGFASRAYYMSTTSLVTPDEEAAGKVGKILGVVAAVVVPFAAPAIFGAIAGSGVLGAGLASAAAAGTVGTMTSILGSAAVGGILSAGIAYAGGARGGDVWRAAGIGAIGSGISSGAGALGSGAANAASGAASVAQPAGGALTVTPQTTSALAAYAAPMSASAAEVAAAASGATAASGGVSNTIMGGIRQVFGNVDGDTMRRIGATLVNAAVNNQNMGNLNALVAQQRAELEALAASDKAAYDQRIAAAQQILSDADKMDPMWHARVAMADVAGVEANEFRQTMRDIAVRQGGSYDKGQQKAYSRGQALHTARSKALVYNQAFKQAAVGRNQLRNAGAQLLGPNTAGMRAWELGTDLEAARYREESDNRRDTFGTFAGLAMEAGDHRAATSPDPSEPEQEERGFSSGLLNPFGNRS